MEFYVQVCTGNIISRQEVVKIERVNEILKSPNSENVVFHHGLSLLLLVMTGLSIVAGRLLEELGFKAQDWGSKNGPCGFKCFFDFKDYPIMTTSDTEK